MLGHHPARHGGAAHRGRPEIDRFHGCDQPREVLQYLDGPLGPAAFVEFRALVPGAGAPGRRRPAGLRRWSAPLGAAHGDLRTLGPFESALDTHVLDVSAVRVLADGASPHRRGAQDLVPTGTV